MGFAAVQRIICFLIAGSSLMMLSYAMLLGRVEINTLLVQLSPVLWRD